jgi:hypothetical protein
MSNVQYGSKPLQYCYGKTYYIGDVHNEADKLMSLLDQVLLDFLPEDRIVFLGDLVDRGTQAALLVKVLVDLNRKYPDQIFFVRGNHDWMLQHYLTTGRRDWFNYLLITLEDFKTQWSLPDIEPNTIMEALVKEGFHEITSKMLPYYETEDVIATHAPLDEATVRMYAGDHLLSYKQDYANREEDPSFQYLLDRMSYEILWQFTGEEFEIDGLDKFRICGHQPGNGKHPRIFKDRAFIDTGCGKGNRPVTALIYPGKRYLQSKT